MKVEFINENKIKITLTFEELEKRDISLKDITNNSSSSSDDSVLSIQVTGSYIDLCDFVFEIENDDSLRFKLDNISMSGSSEAVTATFDVKNTIVIK